MHACDFSTPTFDLLLSLKVFCVLYLMSHEYFNLMDLACLFPKLDKIFSIRDNYGRTFNAVT